MRKEKMRSVTVAIVLASAAQAFARDSMDELVDTLADKLIDRISNGPHLHHAELDDATLGKPADQINPTSPLSLMAVPRHSAATLRTPTLSRPHQMHQVAYPGSIHKMASMGPKQIGPLPSRATTLTAPQNSPTAPQDSGFDLHDAIADRLPKLPMLSGLKGKAMQVEMSDIPTKAQVRAAMPPHVLTRDTGKSLMYAAASVIQSLACVAIGAMIPLQAAWIPAWIAYAAVTGTVWTGMWVVAHECGHGAFSDNKFIQDTVGYILHTALLVPYFSWQHSHAVHHANTNHITKGETHVPPVVNARKGIENDGGESAVGLQKFLGKHIYPAVHAFTNLVFGWPVYLMTGASGGPKYGTSNHFIPAKPFDTKLWPGNWPKKVLQSDIGIVGMVGLLVALAWKFGVGSVAALYVLPLIVTNMWLVGYTWLQHTDVDVPHLSNNEHNFMRGAFLTIDRPYGPLFDYLHHSIGSTHVAHHIDCTIPHYHAREATEAIAKAFPKAYLYDPTPVHEALWRVAANCAAVKFDEKTGKYTWILPEGKGWKYDASKGGKSPASTSEGS